MQINNNACSLYSDTVSYTHLIVTYTLKSMLELSKKEKEYSLGLDLIHYYKTEIEPKNIITEAEFKSLCGDVGINLV